MFTAGVNSQSFGAAADLAHLAALSAGGGQIYAAEEGQREIRIRSFDFQNSPNEAFGLAGGV